VSATGGPTTDEPTVAASDYPAPEAATVRALYQLNAEWIRALTDCDNAWYSEYLNDGFVCTMADGRRLNKHDFLRHVQEQPRGGAAGCDDVDVHPLDDVAVALVHGVIHVWGEALTLMRYTITWQAMPERWQAVAAQFTALERGPSAGKKRRRRKAATLTHSLAAVRAVRRLVSPRRVSRAGLARGEGSAATKRG
jgi:hypothetical protein